MNINNFLLAPIYLAIVLFFMVSIGIILVKKNEVFSENYFLVFPIGFVVYFGLSFVFYMPFIFITHNLVVLLIVEIAKNFFIVYYLIFNMKPFLKDFWHFLSRYLFPLLLITIVTLLISWSFINNSQPPSESKFIGWIFYNVRNDTFNQSNWFDGSKVDNVGNEFLTQTWYYFNSVVEKIFNFDINVLNFWINGAISILLIYFVVLSFLSFFSRKKYIQKYVITFVVVNILILALFHNTNISNTNFFGTFLVFFIFVLFAYLMKSGKAGIIIFINISAIAAWSFASFTLFILIFSYFSLFLYMCIARHKSIFNVVLPISIPIGFFYAVFYFFDSAVLFLIIASGLCFLWVLSFLLKLGGRQLRSISDSRLHNNGAFFYGFALFIVLAFGLGLIVKDNFVVWKNWDTFLDFNFGSKFINTKTSKLLLFFAYLTSFLLSFVMVLNRWKWANPYKSLFFINIIYLSVFANPVSSILVSKYLLPDGFFAYLLYLPLIVTLSFLAIIPIRKVNRAWLLNFGMLASLACIIVPPTLNIQIINNGFDSPYGYKDKLKVSQYLNSTDLKKYQKDFKIEGDVRGLLSLTGFAFNEDTLSDSLYNSVINSRFFLEPDHQKFVKNGKNLDNNYILIKQIDHVYSSQDDLSRPIEEREFNKVTAESKTYHDFGFVSYQVVGNFIIYLPFANPQFSS